MVEKSGLKNPDFAFYSKEILIFFLNELSLFAKND